MNPLKVAAIRAALQGVVAAFVAAVGDALLTGEADWRVILGAGLVGVAQRMLEGVSLDRGQPPQAGLLGGKPEHPSVPYGHVDPSPEV